MAVNRFTKYTPREFVQTYDPYPADKMMGLAQHQQRRFDQIDTAIGKAYADAVIKPGLSVEGRRTAAAVNKERKEQLDNVVNNFAEDRNVRNAVRGLSELSSTWKSDTRADFVNADRELMKPILNQTGQEGYGDYYTHKSYNPTTGEHTLGYTDEQIAAGVAPTMADYGAMSNPGSTAAFKTFIDPVKDVLTQGMTQDPQGNWITKEGKYLDAQQFLDKAGPDIDLLSSDGTNLDQISDADPETQKFINYQTLLFKRKGKNFTLNDLKGAFLTEAHKHTFGNEKVKIKNATKAQQQALVNSTVSPLKGAVRKDSNARLRMLNKEAHERGEAFLMETAGFNDVDAFETMVVNPENSKSRDELLSKDTYDKTYKQFFDEKGNPTVKNQKRRMVNGKMQVFPKISKEEVKKEADKLNAERKDALDKAFYFRQKAIDQLTNAEINQLRFNEDGTVMARVDFPNYKAPTFSTEQRKEIIKKRIQKRTEEQTSPVSRAQKEMIARIVLDASDEELAGNPVENSKRVMEKLRTVTNQEIKKHFGNREFFNSQYHLKTKNNMEITSMTDAMHQEIQSMANSNSKEPRMMSIAGVDISNEDLDDIENVYGEDMDFRGGEFDADYIEFDFVGDGQFKVFANGYLTKPGKDPDNDKVITDRSKQQFQVDITAEFMQKLPESQRAQLMYQDAIIDVAYDLIPDSDEKVSVYLNENGTKEAEEYLGGEAASISKYTNTDGNELYDITGRVAIFDENGQMEIVDAESDSEGRFSQLSQQEMLAMSRDIASALPFIKGDNIISMSPAERQAVNDAGIETTEVDSFDVGLFKLNTQDNSSPQEQIAIGFASNMERYVPINQMTPTQQADYSSKLFVNGKGGWDQWDVTTMSEDGGFENPKFGEALKFLASSELKDASPDQLFTALRNKYPGDNINIGDVKSVTNAFNDAMLQVSSKSRYSKSDIAEDMGTTDAMVALATVIASSGFNNDAVEVVKKG